MSERKRERENYLKRPFAKKKLSSLAHIFVARQHEQLKIGECRNKVKSRLINGTERLHLFSSSNQFVKVMGV